MWLAHPRIYCDLLGMELANDNEVNAKTLSLFEEQGLQDEKVEDVSR